MNSWVKGCRWSTSPRHGETAWSLSGQRAGWTDLPLSDHGERNARKLGNSFEDAISRAY